MDIFSVALIGYLLAVVTGLLLSFAGFLGEFAIHIQTLIVNNGFVQEGWIIARDITNLGFVLMIIVIAFATILRREEYGVKKLLPKLIAAAIIVNFSLTIGALIIDFSQTVTTFFWSKVSPENPVGTISRLIAVIQPQQVLNAPSKPDFLKTLLNFSGTLVNLTIGPYFIAIFNLVAIIVFLSLALMFYVRFFMLSFLLVISPMVYLFNLIPALSKYFQNWWDSFIKWVIFAPAVSFFIYLSFKTVGGIKAAQFGQNNKNLLLAGIDETIKIIFIPFLNMLLVTGFLIGGMIMANKMGITGAKGGMNLLEKVGNGVKGWAGRQAKSRIDRLRTGRREYNRDTKETTTALQRFGSSRFFQRFPVLSGVGTFLAKQGTEVERKGPQEIEKYRQENLQPLTNEGLIARATSRTAFLDPTSAAAIAQELAKRNLTNDPQITAIPGLVDRFLQTAERMGNAQAMYNNRPDLILKTPKREVADPTAPSGFRSETDAEMIARAIKGIKVPDIVQIDARVLGDALNIHTPPTKTQIDAVLNISNPNLGKLAIEGSPFQIEAIRNTVRQTLDQFTAGTLVLDTGQEKNLERIMEYLDRNPYWQKI